MQKKEPLPVGKKKKRRPRRENWTRPPLSAERRAAEEEWRRSRAALNRPPLPQKRLIATLFGLALVTLTAFLMFLLPGRSLVKDLRSRGISVVAEVTAASKNKYGDAGNVKVRFDGPDGTVETELHDWGGKRPEGLRAGAAVPVTYDPQEPTRVLTTRWVEDPPTATLPMLVTAVLTPLLLSGAVFLVVRRRRLLKAGEQADPTA
ncbi:DUF3592 domain-containing protein [Streptomyces althioticus]|uniref:DUF3592 domain-containing protein n=1 Tax=Streptomyces althioticus TaxID=83380 RepID=UPI00380B72AC